MTKAKRADALLCAAKHWQSNDSASPHPCCAGKDGWVDVCLSMSGYGSFTTWASAALSEVGALGFDVEDVT